VDFGPAPVVDGGAIEPYPVPTSNKEAADEGTLDQRQSHDIVRLAARLIAHAIRSQQRRGHVRGASAFRAG
jgi:hypothetical protein